MLKVIYSIFLGIVLALFVNMGVSTFYQEPDISDYDRGSSGLLGDASEYSQALDDYERNAAIIMTLLAVGLLIAGLHYRRQMEVVADGITLGGIFALINGIVRSQSSDDEALSFIIVTIAVAAALFLGYRRFAEQPSASKSKKAGR